LQLRPHQPRPRRRRGRRPRYGPQHILLAWHGDCSLNPRPPSACPGAHGPGPRRQGQRSVPRQGSRPCCGGGVEAADRPLRLWLQAGRQAHGYAMLCYAGCFARSARPGPALRWRHDGVHESNLQPRRRGRQHRSLRWSMARPRRRRGPRRTSASSGSLTRARPLPWSTRSRPRCRPACPRCVAHALVQCSAEQQQEQRQQ
jgi:hypothetical protein